MPDELKEKANEMMQQLDDTYSKQDLNQVKKVLNSLENGIEFELSSETIEDKELLKEKIKEYKENIKNIKFEIDGIKEDETYTTIASLDDWNEYFKKVKNELKKEIKRLEDEAKEVLQKSNDNEVPKWILQLWDWADKNKISKNSIPRVQEQLIKLKSLELVNMSLDYLPIELSNLTNLVILKLWDCSLEYLPLEIVKLTNLKTLNLRGNKLSLTNNQKAWLLELEKNGCIIYKEFISFVSEDVIRYRYNAIYNNTNKNAEQNKSVTEEVQEASKENIKEYKDNIKNIKSEIDDIKEDETYTTIASLDDWNEYFKEFRNGLEGEKEKLEEEARGVLEEKIDDKSMLIYIVENWIINYLGKVRDQTTLQRITDTSIRVAQELLDKNKSNINLKFLVVNKGSFKHIRHDNVTLTTFDIYDINAIKDVYLNLLNNEQNVKNEAKKNVVVDSEIKKENTLYSNYIKSIQNPNFEKIRRYCNNLVNDNDDVADNMQEYLAKNGKMYKALIYSSLEVFIENLNGKTITLCDWECSQGIASMLVLDYIKEKQLNIQVSNVMLIDDDTKILSRAMVQVEALAQNSVEVTAIKSDDNALYDKINANKKHTILHLFANDKIPIVFTNINDNVFDNDFIVLISNKNREFVENSYEDFKSFMNVENISIQDGKIGRFNKYERIFKVGQNIPTIDIDEYDLPF